MPKKFPLTKDILDKMVAEYGTPLQIYDGSGIESTIQDMNERMNCFHFTNYFAVKALPNPEILKIMLQNDCGLDCSSVNEVKLALLSGASEEQLIFTGNYTSIEDYNYIFDKNIFINLDDYEILERTNNIPETISFRINVQEDSIDSQNVTVLGGVNSKFGIAENDILKAYSIAKEKGVKEYGIHIMYGSNVKDYEYWKNLSNKFIEFMVLLKKELDIDITFINFGGGVGIPYYLNEPTLDVLNIQRTIKDVFSNNSIGKEFLKNDNSVSKRKIYFECGRYITGPHGWLVTRCDSIKKTNGVTFYGLDACMSNLMRPGMYGSYHYIDTFINNHGYIDKEKYPNIIQPTENDETPCNGYHRNGECLCIYKEFDTEPTNKIKANIVGKLCENNDWFAKDRLIYQSKINDYFIIYDTGAHSHSMGFQYNGRLRCPEILLHFDVDYKSGEGCICKELYTIIRKRETFEDYISTILNNEKKTHEYPFFY